MPYLEIKIVSFNCVAQSFKSNQIWFQIPYCRWSLRFQRFLEFRALMFIHLFIHETFVR